MLIRICVGTGGVGKTTCAAATALSLARQGKKTLVITIDPARRLSSLLGLDREKGEHRIPIEASGELWAALLDVEHTLETAVRTYGNPDQIRTVLDHPIYRMLISSLSGMEELMAIEYLDQVRRMDFDAVVLDTAPSRHAFEFLDKPEYFARLVDFPLVRLVGKTFKFWSDSPLGALGRRSMGLYSKLEELVGAGVVGQVLSFYHVFRSIAEGYADRAKKTVSLLRDPSSTRFSIVTVPGKALRDIEYFLSELQARRFHADQVILNRVWPKPAEADLGSEVEERLLEAWYRSVSDEHWTVVSEAARLVTASRASVLVLNETATAGSGIDLVEDLSRQFN